MELRKPSSLLSPSTTLNAVNNNAVVNSSNNASSQNNGTSTSNQKVPYLPGHHQLAAENQKLSSTAAAHGFGSSAPSDEKAGYAVAATNG